MSLRVLPLLLKKNVRDRIIKQIEDMKSFSDWCHFDTSINAADLDLSTLIYDDVIEQLKIFEDIAKLSIDLWRDHNYYRKFCFDMGHDNNEYREVLESLGCVCVDGKWKSVCRPSDDIVQMNVFKYCLYRQIYDEMRRHKSIICPFCNAPIRLSEDKCESCGASIEEIIIYKETISTREEELLDKKVKKELSNNDGDRKSDCDKCVFLEDGSVEMCEDCKRNEGHIAVDRWKCGKCGLLQSYDCTRCDVCGDSRMMRGLWRCAKCTLINECNNDVCMACGDCNELLMTRCEYCNKKVAMNEVRCVDCARMHSVHHGAVRWQCWYNNCGAMNTVVDQYCGKCRLWRHNSPNRGDIAYLWKNGGHIVVWVCSTCYHPNPPSQSVCKQAGCGHTRYDKIWCLRCLSWTDGTTKYCEKHRV